jgi:hypothetical protein
MPGFAIDGYGHFLGITHCLTAGDNLGNKFPARAAFGQMRYDKLTYFNGNPVVYKSSSVFAARVPRFVPVRTFTRHANFSLLEGLSVPLATDTVLWPTRSGCQTTSNLAPFEMLFLRFSVSRVFDAR